MDSVAVWLRPCPERFWNRVVAAQSLGSGISARNLHSCGNRSWVLGPAFRLRGNHHGLASDRIIFLSFAGFSSSSPGGRWSWFRATSRLRPGPTELAFQGKATTARRIPKVKPGVVDVVGLRGAIGSLLVFWLFLTLIIAPNVVNVWQSSRQKKTMSSLRFVVTAVEAYAVDHGEFPEAATVEELVSLLTPDYVKTLPTVDGWGWPLEYYRVDNKARFPEPWK